MLAALNTKRLPVIYGLLWMTITVIHFVLLKNVYGFSPGTSWGDSLVFNILFAILGMGLWFMVRFSDLHKKSFTELLFYHLTSATGILFIWTGLSFVILRKLLQSDTAYLSFLSGSLTMRIFLGILYYTVHVITYYLIINFRELQEKKDRENQLQSLLKEAELNLLRSQIRPHFLFNSLNSISSLTMIDPVKAQEMVIKLSAFMRYSLDTRDNTMSTLEKELHHTDLYLDIEKVRFGKRLQIDKNIEETALAWTMPAMILQPLIENSVKYGVYESTDISRITIEARITPDYLAIRIGNPFDEDSSPHKGTGTGIRNIEARLKHLYGRQDLLKIVKDKDYFELELMIPENVR
ncbi:MAG TPA: histidine kinase [Bacteroidales bacterium]|nr:histidine kinase [Bacteroidales bacterium]HRZ21032.1 histidine kinase [Bacteroidales bacterium]